MPRSTRAPITALLFLCVLTLNHSAAGLGQTHYEETVPHAGDFAIAITQAAEIVHRLPGDWKPLAQVHSHPGLRVEHSNYDDRMVGITLRKKHQALKRLLASRAASEIVGYIRGCRRCFRAQEPLSSIPMSSFTTFVIVARRRAEKKLDIFEFASGLLAETSTANLVGSEPSQAAVGGELLHEEPPNPPPCEQARSGGALSYKLMPKE